MRTPRTASEGHATGKCYGVMLQGAGGMRVGRALNYARSRLLRFNHHQGWEDSDRTECSSQNSKSHLAPNSPPRETQKDLVLFASLRLCVSQSHPSHHPRKPCGQGFHSYSPQTSLVPDQPRKLLGDFLCRFLHDVVPHVSQLANRSVRPSLFKTTQTLRRKTPILHSPYQPNR